MIYFILILTQIEAFILLYHIVVIHRKVDLYDERLHAIRNRLIDIRFLDRDGASPYMLDHLEKVILTLQAYVDKIDTKIDRMMHK